MQFGEHSCKVVTCSRFGYRTDNPQKERKRSHSYGAERSYIDQQIMHGTHPVFNPVSPTTPRVTQSSNASVARGDTKRKWVGRVCVSYLMGNKYEKEKGPAEARGCLLAGARAREPRLAVNRPRRAHARGPPTEAPHAAVGAQGTPRLRKRDELRSVPRCHLGQFDLPLA